MSEKELCPFCNNGTINDGANAEYDIMEAKADLVPKLLDLKGIDRDGISADYGYEPSKCIACNTVLEDNWQHCPNPECPRFQGWELTQADNHYWADKRSEYDIMEAKADMVDKLVKALGEMTVVLHPDHKQSSAYKSVLELINKAKVLMT